MKKITPLFGIIVIALLSLIAVVIITKPDDQENFVAQASPANEQGAQERNEQLLEENGFSDEEAKALTENENETMNAVFTTNKGTFEIELFDELAPKTVENFVKLSKENFYDGVKFHRVIKGFMIQSGDPLSKDDDMQDRWGTGGPGYQFDDEIHENNNNNIGTIAMANAGPNTNGSQFFINTADNNFLDDKHTVFGKVTDGMDVVRAIEGVETLPNDRPVEPVIIESITIK